MQDRGYVYGQQKMIAQYACSGEWLFYLEGDELVHEQDLEKIYDAVQSFVEANQAEEKNEEEIQVEFSDSDNIEINSKSEQNPDEKTTKKTPEEEISNELLSETNTKQSSEDKLEKVQS